MIRIDKNESPYRALTDDEIAQLAINTHFNQYADDEYVDLQKSYAAFNNLNPDLISFANGSDEWIQKSMIVLADGPVLVLEPDFVMYEVYAKQFNRPLTKINCREDWTFDYEEIYNTIRELRPSVFIFSQPNNPIGTLHPADFIEKAAELMKEVNGYLIIDEAYGEFNQEPTEYPEGDHVVRFRTLSKVYGLAGLRVGVAVASQATIDKLNSIAHPYPLNTFSLNVSNYLLNQTERLIEFIELNRTLSRKLLRIFKEEVGDVISVIDSSTNFVLTYGEKAVDLGEYVVKNGFLPRMYPESDNEALRKTVRYSIAKDEQLNQLQTILKEWRNLQ